MFRALQYITSRFLLILMVFMLIIPNALAAGFYLKDNDNLRKGCPGKIEVMIDSEGANVLAADSTMTFGAAELTVTNMSLGVALPMQTYNQIAGTILELSGARLPATGSFNGDALYGTISVTPAITANQATVNFSPDLTRDNVIAEEGTFANIITSAVGKTFTIKERYNKEVDGVGFCNPDKTPPTVNFILPPNGSSNNEVDTNIIFSIDDNRSGVDISTLDYTIGRVSYTETSSQTSYSESGGVFRVETNPTSNFTQGQTVQMSVYICDKNTDPAPNCTTVNGQFTIYSPPPPAPVCGDGKITYTRGEQCDDGNTEDGDGCSAHCFLEVEPIECPECDECDETTVGLTIVKEAEECVQIAVPPTTEEPQPEVASPVTEEEEPQFFQEEWPEVSPPEIKAPPIPGCTREDIVEDVLKEFNIKDRFGEKDARCLEDLEHCMLPFLINSSYPDASPENGRYYPDVYLNGERSTPLLKDDAGPRSTISKTNIHQSTRLGMVQGYYDDTANLSPFRPEWNMTRMQIIKVLNWAVFQQPWIYEQEYYTTIGGEQNFGLVKKMAADLTTWWHPRYYNFACDMGVFDCDPLNSVGPDEICSPEWKREVFARYKAFFEGEKIKVADPVEDTDGDTIPDLDEDNIFMTNPKNKDTDGDKLTDEIEIFIHKSNPLLIDSDYDTLSDGDEVNTYKTNPINPDTDGDEYPDNEEINAGTDPLDPFDYPEDKNKNGIMDSWEQKYGISPTSGSEDYDGDGLSDLLEYKHGTDPTNPDTDGDGLTDAEEVLIYKSDPLTYTNIADLGVRITNIVDGMILTDLRPMIQGIAPKEGMEVELLIRNEFGHEVLLGSTVTDENNSWIFTPDFDLMDGEFYLLAKGLDVDDRQVLLSPMIGVTLDSSLQVTSPSPERLANVPVTEEVLLEGVRLEISDDKPVLIGTTGFKHKVVATWQSVVGSSAIVADLAGGAFKIESPNALEYGDHTVSVYAVREKDQAMSKVINITFEVKEPLSEVLRGVSLGEEVAVPVWVLMLGGFAVIGGFWYKAYRARKLLRIKKK